VLASQLSNMQKLNRMNLLEGATLKLKVKKRVKNSKKFNFCKLKLRNIVIKTNAQLNVNKTLTVLPPSSFIKMKLEKKPSIFKFKNRQNKQNKIKSV